MPTSDTRSPALLSSPIHGAAAVFLAVAFLLSLGVAIFAYVSIPDVAYIDTSMLMERYDKAVAARKEMGAEQATWNQNVQTLQAELGALSQELVDEGAQWEAAKRQAEQDTLEEKRRELARYRRAVQEKAEKLRQETMKPVYSELNAEIEAFGKEKGYDLILGTLQGGNILFAEDAVDVTERFLSHVNEEEEQQLAGSQNEEVAEVRNQK